jgi:hypothetical protein
VALGVLSGGLLEATAAFFGEGASSMASMP